jgi:hypothetical protein
MTSRDRAAVPGQRAAPEDQDLPVFVDVLLREYDSLRRESLQAINNRILIMSFAFTSLAVITAAILSSSVPRGVLVPICLVFIPVSAKASLLIWLGEYHRSQRAGQGIARIEKRINDQLKDPSLLTWESGLVSSSTHVAYPYVATAAYMLSIGILALGLGIFYLAELVVHQGPLIAGLAITGGVLYSVVLEALFIRFFLTRWRAIQSYSRPT